MPDRTTLDKKYLDECYQDAICEIQDSLGDTPIRVGVDETTDAIARYVANVLIGRHDNEMYHAHYLVDVVILEKTNLPPSLTRPTTPSSVCGPIFLLIC